MGTPVGRGGRGSRTAFCLGQECRGRPSHHSRQSRHTIQALPRLPALARPRAPPRAPAAMASPTSRLTPGRSGMAPPSTMLMNRSVFSRCSFLTRAWRAAGSCRVVCVCVWGGGVPAREGLRAWVRHWCSPLPFRTAPLSAARRRSSCTAHAQCGSHRGALEGLPVPHVLPGGRRGERRALRKQDMLDARRPAVAGAPLGSCAGCHPERQPRRCNSCDMPSR